MQLMILLVIFCLYIALLDAGNLEFSKERHSACSIAIAKDKNIPPIRAVDTIMPF